MQSQNYRWKYEEVENIGHDSCGNERCVSFDGKRIEWPGQAYVMADRPDLV